MPPASVMMTEMTAANIGRLMKKLAMATAPQLAVSLADLLGCDLCCLLLLGLDLLPRPHALEAFDDDLLAGLEAAGDNPILAALGTQFHIATRGEAVGANDVYEFDALIG